MRFDTFWHLYCDGCVNTAAVNGMDATCIVIVDVSDYGYQLGPSEPAGVAVRGNSRRTWRSFARNRDVWTLSAYAVSRRSTGNQITGLLAVKDHHRCEKALVSLT